MSNKTLVLGDTHGHTTWKDVVSKEDFDRLVFIGDYFDTHANITAEQQINNFLDIVEYKKSGGKEVIMLIGNHDYHYFPEIGYQGYSGYQAKAAPAISHLLALNREHLQMCHIQDSIIFTHAGIGETFLESRDWKGEDIEVFLNDLWKFKPTNFFFNGFDSTGDDIGQSPIWIRPRSLMRDSKTLKNTFIQVAGHTTMKRIESHLHTDCRYYFIDVLGTSGEYLLITDGKIEIKK